MKYNNKESLQYFLSKVMGYVTNLVGKYVPLTRKINNKILKNDIILTKDDIGLGNVTNDALVKLSELGVPNGVATLGSNGLIRPELLPGFVDEVIEGYYNGAIFYKNSSHTILIIPEVSKLYVDITNPLKPATYRWSGSMYVIISDYGTLDSRISNNAVGIATLTPKVNSNITNIANLRRDVNNNITDILSIRTNVTNNTNSINSIQSDLTTDEANWNIVSNKASKNEIDITEIKNDLTDTINTLDTTKTLAELNETNINSITVEFNRLVGTVLTNTNNIETISNNISTAITDSAEAKLKANEALNAVNNVITDELINNLF